MSTVTTPVTIDKAEQVMDGKKPQLTSRGNAQVDVSATAPSGLEIEFRVFGDAEDILDRFEPGTELNVTLERQWRFVASSEVVTL